MCVNQWAVVTADTFRGLQLSHFYVLHFLLLERQPALTGALAKIVISTSCWPELGTRPHPISSTGRQYQTAVGDGGDGIGWQAVAWKVGGQGRLRMRVESHQLWSDVSPQTEQIIAQHPRQWIQIMRQVSEITEKLNAAYWEKEWLWPNMTREGWLKEGQ